jgi:serine/threonine protein kinase
MPPEYAVHGHYSIKSDVFSFGVLVLEIISGKKNKGFSDPEHSLNLLGHVSSMTICFPHVLNCLIVDKIQTDYYFSFPFFRHGDFGLKTHHWNC